MGARLHRSAELPSRRRIRYGGGSYYNEFVFDNGSKLAPLLQVLGSVREHDVGLNASQPIDGINQSGYQRLLISPGLEYDIDKISLYGDVEVRFSSTPTAIS